MDDFLGKKKETAPILDLSKVTAHSKEELRKILDKVPDIKMRPEKVRPEDIKIREKNFKFKTGKKDIRTAKEPFTFANPIPLEMRSLKLEDLVSVPIDWRMLTTLRPKTKLEEAYFTRIIELKKLEQKTAAKDKLLFAKDTMIRKSKNKAGIIEQRVVSCVECGEEFCDGRVCKQYGYECFARVQVQSLNQGRKEVEPKKESKKKKKIHRKSRSKSRSKRGGSKSKSPKQKSKQ